MALLNEAALNLQEGLSAAIRAIKETSRLASEFTKHSVRAHYNLIGKFTFPIEQEITETRPPSPKDLNKIGQFALGLSGVLPVTWVSSVTLIPLVGNSIQSLIRSFVACFDLPTGNKLKVPHVLGMTDDDNRNVVRKYMFGGIGIVFGGIVGVTATLISNSINTGTRSFNSIANFALANNDQFSIPYFHHKDERHWAKKYLLGFPGLIFGGLTGIASAVLIGFGRTVSNTLLTTLRFSLVMSNLVLHRKDKIGINKDKREKVEKFGFGLPGYLFGTVFGSVGILAILGGRFITNNVKTAKRTVVSLSNLVMHPEDKQPFYGLEQNDKKRGVFRKYILGFPGLVLGGVIGAFSIVVIGVARMITNIAKTTKRTFVTIFNAGLRAEDKIKADGLEQNDGKRGVFRKYILGFPGLILGGLSGTLTTLIVHSAKTFANTFVSMTRFALHPKDKDKLPGDSLSSSPRHKIHKFLIGFPGLILGGIIGSFSILAVSLGRIMTNSAKSFLRVVVTCANAILHEDDKLHLKGLGEDDDRPLFFQAVAGLPGLFLGDVVGSLAFVSIALGRVVTNSFKTGRQVFVLFSNSVLAKDENDPEKDDRFNTDFIAKDKRPNRQKYGFGLPGVIFGGILGCVSIATIGFGRVITNSAKSFGSIFVSLSRLALHPEDKHEISGDSLSSDGRSRIRKFVVGFPGLVLGSLFGVASILTIGVGRIITNNLKTLVRTVVTFSNFVLAPPEDMILRNGLEQNERRSFFRKYILGLPGLLLGGVIGLFSAGLIGLGRVVSQSVKSWSFFSGSLMNGAIEKPYFTGLGGDGREAKEKILGALGYPLAICTTLPVAMLTYATRKLPAVLSLGLGAVVSPIVFICKSLSKTYKKFNELIRFPAPLQNDEYIKRFKNIYSSLDTFGKLSAGTKLPVNGTGEKSWSSFIRKCFTFNAKSVTERTLDEILVSYKKGDCNDEEKAAQFFNNSEQFKAAVLKVKNYYSNDCFVTDDDIKNTFHEIDDVADFVVNYMHQQKGVPLDIPKDFYTKHQKTWSAAFWGSAGNAPAPMASALDDEVSLSSAQKV